MTGDSASSSNLFLGLEWPPMMQPLTFNHQGEPILEQNDEVLGIENAFNDVVIDPDLLTFEKKVQ